MTEETYPSILPADFVKSYDFPDFDEEGKITARAERCYIFGQVEAVLTMEEAREVHYELGSCPRYKIRVMTRVWDSQVAQKTDDYIYPPVNGTPMWGNQICKGVIRVKA